MKYITLLFSGIIFGIGLVLSGMTNPLKVQNFLDLFGLWDPSLAFVMGGAIFVLYQDFGWFKNRKNHFLVKNLIYQKEKIWILD